MQTAKDFISILMAALPGIAVRKLINKGDYLLREGQVERHLYYVESGAIRVFHLQELEEQTIRFGYKGSVINSLASFLNGTPSEFYIEAMRKSVVQIISRDDLYTLVNESHENLQAYTALMEMVVSSQVQREIDLLTASPQARLNRVLQRSPDLFQQVPLKYIASYLRMKPETLSRIRNS